MKYLDVPGKQTTGQSTGEQLTRRKFVRSAALTGAGISLSSSLMAWTDQRSSPAYRSSAFQSSAPQPQAVPWTIHFFSKHLQFLRYREMARTCAEAGLDGIDLTVRPGGHVLPENVERDLPEAAKAIRDAGLELVMMTTAITDPDDPLTRKILETASRLGIRYYRMGYYRYDAAAGVEKNLTHIRKTMGKLATLNKEYGIHGAYQNHSGNRFGGPVWDIWEVVRDMDPQWIGCQYDIRHAVVEGAQSWPLGLQLLQNHIQYMVIKDFRWEESDGEWRIQNVPLGKGMVDFSSFFSKVRELKIAGPLSLHIEYPLYSDEMKTLEEQRESAIQFIAKDVASLRSLLVSAKLILNYFA